MDASQNDKTEFYNALLDVLTNHPASDVVEVEIRFGTLRHGKWTADIPPTTHNVILKNLISYQKWEQVLESNVSYVYYANGVRQTQQTAKSGCLQKTVCTEKIFECKSTNVALKICVMHETPCPLPQSEPLSYRAVQRSSFVYKDFLRYDISQTVQMPFNASTPPKYQHELELEIKKCGRSADHTALSVIAKVDDMLEMCGVKRSDICLATVSLPTTRH
jgi:hypothetical protein